jgi:hypothetical protein
MTNWAYNVISVSGDRETLQQFRKAVGSYGEEKEVQIRDYATNKVSRQIKKIVNVFDLEKIIPYPEGFDAYAEVEVPSFFNDDRIEKEPAWYVWNTENWGTLWNSDKAVVIDDGENLVFTFNTAWTFPEPIFDRIVEDWRSLSFKFHLTEEFQAYDIEAKASKGQYHYAYDYYVINSAGYVEGGEEFCVLYRKNLLTGALEPIAQRWFEPEEKIPMSCLAVDEWSRAKKAFLKKEEQWKSSKFKEDCLYRSRDILAFSKHFVKKPKALSKFIKLNDIQG